MRFDLAQRLVTDFPALRFVVNGGIAGNDAIAGALASFDGAMVGRMAYHDPWQLAAWDERFFGAAATAHDRDGVEAAMVAYMAEQQRLDGTPWPRIARHMLGLRHGEPGARFWRQVWSDARLRERPVAEVSRRARAAMAAVAVAA